MEDDLDVVSHAFGFRIPHRVDTQDLDLNSGSGSGSGLDPDHKIVLRDFFKEMKTYMQVNNLTDDEFMKNLCDDVYISYRTFGTRYGEMFTLARQSSQGAQRGYNVSQTPDMDRDYRSYSPSVSPRNLRPPRLVRNNTVSMRGRSFDFPDTDSDADTNVERYKSDSDSDDILHDISCSPRTPYRTPQATQVMNSISGNEYD
jgi:hypothetical protein